jgi:hypothetical protein
LRPDSGRFLGEDVDWASANKSPAKKAAKRANQHWASRIDWREEINLGNISVEPQRIALPRDIGFDPFFSDPGADPDAPSERPEHCVSGIIVGDRLAAHTVPPLESMHLPTDASKVLLDLREEGWVPTPNDVAVWYFDGYCHYRATMSLSALLRIANDARSGSVDGLALFAQLQKKPNATLDTLNMRMFQASVLQANKLSRGHHSASMQSLRAAPSHSEDSQQLVDLGPSYSYSYDIFLLCSNKDIDAAIRRALVTNAGGCTVLRQCLQRVRADPAVDSECVANRRHITVVLEVSPSCAGTADGVIEQQRRRYLSAAARAKKNVSLNASLMNEIQRLAPFARVAMPLGGARPNEPLKAKRAVREELPCAAPRNTMLPSSGLRSPFMIHAKKFHHLPAMAKREPAASAPVQSSSRSHSVPSRSPARLDLLEHFFPPSGGSEEGFRRGSPDRSQTSMHSDTATTVKAAEAHFMQPVGISLRNRRCQPASIEETFIRAAAARCRSLSPDDAVTKRLHELEDYVKRNLKDVPPREKGYENMAALDAGANGDREGNLLNEKDFRLARRRPVDLRPL